MLQNEVSFNDGHAMSPSNQHFNENYLQSNNSEGAGYHEETDKKTGKWTAEEDEMLRRYVPLYGEKQWRKIAEHIPGRNSIQCLHRWTKILKPGLVKGPWTPEEDQRLINWVNSEGPTKWAQCAAFIHGRSGKQCRERWFNNLNPGLKKGNWSEEEDEMIFQLYQKYSSSWSKIAKYLPGRTENAIKNRFYSTLRKLAADKKKQLSDPNLNSDDNNIDSKIKQERNEEDEMHEEAGHEIASFQMPNQQTQQQAQPLQQIQQTQQTSHQQQAQYQQLQQPQQYTQQQGQLQQLQQSQQQARMVDTQMPNFSSQQYQAQNQVIMSQPNISNISMQQQALADSQNALYKLLHEKTQTVIPPINLKFEQANYDYNHEAKANNMEIQAMSNPRYPSANFNTKNPNSLIKDQQAPTQRAGYYPGQPPVYSRPANPFNPAFDSPIPIQTPVFQTQVLQTQNAQKTTMDQLIAQDPLDQDEVESQFEKFLINLDKVLTDDFIYRDLEYSKSINQNQETYEDLDKMQRKIIMHCQSNIRDLNENFKKFSNPHLSDIQESSKLGKESTVTKGNINTSTNENNNNANNYNNNNNSTEVQNQKKDTRPSTGDQQKPIGFVPRTNNKSDEDHKKANPTASNTEKNQGQAEEQNNKKNLEISPTNTSDAKNNNEEGKKDSKDLPDLAASRMRSGSGVFKPFTPIVLPKQDALNLTKNPSDTTLASKNQQSNASTARAASSTIGSANVNTNPNNNSQSLSTVSMVDLAAKLSVGNIGTSNLSVINRLIANVMNDNSTVNEQKLLFTFQQLFSLENMLSNTKNELVKMESHLLTDDIGDTSYMNRRDEFPGLDKSLGQTPIIISNTNEERIMSSDFIRKKHKKSSIDFN